MTDEGFKQALVRSLLIRPILLVLRAIELLIGIILGYDRELANFEITNKKQEFSKLVDPTDPTSDYE